MRFKNGCKNNMSLNQLTVVIVEKIPEEKEPQVYEITEIPEEKVELEKGYYCCVYVMLWFKNDVGVVSKEDQTYVEDDPDDEVDDANLYNKRGHHWRMVFVDNDGGVEDAKVLLHAKRWDVYLDEKKKLVKGGYSVEFVGNEKKKVIWEVVNDHVVEEPTDNEEIVLRGFDLNLFDEDEEGIFREMSSEFPYLLILIKIWPRNWKAQLNSMNQKVY